MIKKTKICESINPPETTQKRTKNKLEIPQSTRIKIKNKTFCDPLFTIREPQEAVKNPIEDKEKIKKSKKKKEKEYGEKNMEA